MVRLRHRYLLCQADFGEDAGAALTVTTADLFAAVRATLMDVFGDAGWGAVASELAGAPHARD